MKNKSFVYILTGASVLLVGVMLVSLMSGSVFYSPSQAVLLLLGPASPGRSILLYSRLPRTLAAVFGGAALSLAGAVLQNVLSNKLASPGIIGVNSGAGFGVTLCCALGIYSGLATSAFAFAGSIAAVFTVFLFASRVSASRSTVILAGVALNSIFTAMSEAVCVLDEDVAALSAQFRVGGFSAVTYSSLLPAMGVITVCSLVLLTLCNELDVLTLGEETASGLGLNTKKYRIIFLIIAALLAGSAVSFSGLLGFVGLIVPHFVRGLTGNSSGRLLPLSALSGALLLCLCDTLSRLIFEPYELPVGIIMAFIGAPAFVYMLVRYRGGHKNA